MNIWGSFAAGVPARAVEVISDLSPVVGLLGGIAIAVAVSGVLYRVFRGGR